MRGRRPAQFEKTDGLGVSIIGREGLANGHGLSVRGRVCWNAHMEDCMSELEYVETSRQEGHSVTWIGDLV